MKKFAFVFFFLFIFYVVTSGSFAMAADDTSGDHVMEVITVTPDPSASVAPSSEVMSGQAPISATATAKNDYTLPYPGILPDNPLYFLKAARDRLVSFLISDLGKKTDFNLLTSDKRISAALTLSGRGKSDLSISTLSKSNNYLAEAVTAAASAQNSGKNIDPVLHNLQNAVEKHKDVLASIKKNLGKKFAPRIAPEESRLEGFNATITKLLPRN